MARSLTVNHEEKPSTSYLLNFFLALAFGWLMLTALAAAASPDSVVVSGSQDVQIDR